MKNKLVIFAILFVLGAVLFVAHRLYAHSSQADQPSSPVQSDLRQSSEVHPGTDCVGGKGYCMSKGYIVIGIHIKQR